MVALTAPARARLPADAAGEAALAARNGAKLLGSLAGTWSIAVAVRLLLPRALGPERFGAFSFADAFVATFFVVLQLGVDVHVRNEVAVRPERASDFLGGVLALRVLIAVALFGAMALVLHAAGRRSELLGLVAALAVAQLLAEQNNTLAAVLHAAGRVDGLSVINVAAKLAWGLGVGASVLAGASLVPIALAAAVAEAGKAVALQALARRHVGLRLRLDVRATRAALVASLPFFVNGAAHAAYARLDVNVLGLVASDREVGFYGAASTLAQLAALVSPLVGWILMPLFARAAARSRDELWTAVRRAMELVVGAVAPLALLLAFAAGPLVELLFGRDFAPAVAPLQRLAPMFVLTWAAVVMASGLIAAGRGWSVTMVSLAALAFDPLLVLLLLPAALERGVPGGGGAACALAMLATESAVALAMARLIGRPLLHPRLLAVLGGTAAAAGCASAVQLLLPPGPPRALLAASAYAAVAIASGALRPREIAGFVSALRRTP